MFFPVLFSPLQPPKTSKSQKQSQTPEWQPTARRTPSVLLQNPHPIINASVTSGMRPHPHQRWASKYPSIPPARKAPKIVAKKFYLQANRLYARTSNLFIRIKDLLVQTQLNDREVQLQDYFGAERETRGNGSPLDGNPQQVYTFSATTESPINTVIDDFTEFVDPLPVRESELEFFMIPFIESRVENPYQRMVDRSHRRLVRSFMGPPSGSDMATVMRMERSVSAQEF